MDQRLISGLALIICILCCRSFLKTETAASDDPPNIVIILADDLGYGDLGCYDHPIIKTPNLDQFALDGLRYTNCYASAPMCSPSRAGLLTGRVPYRTGIYDWIAPDSTMHLDNDEITIASLLQSHGYHTSHIGKWHLNGRFNVQDQTQPHDHGFDYWLSTQYSSKHKNPSGFVRNGVPLDSMPGYSCQIVAREASDWIRKKRNKSKPFFQFVCFHEPHEPIMSPPHLVQQYHEHAAQSEYYANVTNMDSAVGILLQTLEEEGLSENTLVIFTSDNGPAEYTPNGYFNKSHGSAGPLKGYKRHQFEGGIRVPGIMRWPGNIAPGICSDAISNLDFLPTICALAKIKVPGDRVIDGADISPLFSGRPVLRQIPLHWHFYDPWGGPQSLLREGNWMLGANWQVGDFHKQGRFHPAQELPVIKQSKLVQFSLYDLESDIHQDVDLASDKPKIVKKFAPRLTELHRAVMQDAPFPKPKIHQTAPPLDSFLQVDLFEGGEFNVFNYRIPALTKTSSGTLLAICDARVDRRGDIPNHIDLMMRRSTDNGVSWSYPKVILDYPAPEGGGDPCLVTDLIKNRTWLFYVYSRGKVGINQSRPGFHPDSTQQLMGVHSDDEGLTWSEPENLTTELKDSAWAGVFFASGHGIQTKDGKLVLTMMVRETAGTAKNDKAYMIYSEDHGSHWKVSGPAGELMGESKVVELEDGRIMINMRSKHKKGQRAVSITNDLGVTWSPYRHDPYLTEPACNASIISAVIRNQSYLVFSNPAHQTKRVNMSVKLSDDQGNSWSEPATLHKGPSGYSSMVMLDDGAIGLLYERGSKRADEKITFARISSDWLLRKNK